MGARGCALYFDGSVIQQVTENKQDVCIFLLEKAKRRRMGPPGGRGVLLSAVPISWPETGAEPLIFIVRG
jgi:hypothetical protein